jgi:uncharacterized membrane protein
MDFRGNAVERAQLMTQPQPPNNSAIGGAEIAISMILRIGVVASLSIVVLGTVLSFVHHYDYVSSHDELHRLTSPPADFPRTATQIWQGARHGNGEAIIMAGLLLLLATPVLRVAVSILAFAYEKDGAFVVITSIVLALLLLSFVLGRVTEG